MTVSWMIYDIYYFISKDSVIGITQGNLCSVWKGSKATVQQWRLYLKCKIQRHYYRFEGVCVCVCYSAAFFWSLILLWQHKGYLGVYFAKITDGKMKYKIIVSSFLWWQFLHEKGFKKLIISEHIIDMRTENIICFWNMLISVI